jgi:hypothetical protein
MVTAWPKNLPGPGVAAQMLADRITALSGGRIEVELFAAGEIVPGPGVFDAVSEGTAELYHAVPAYWGSKSKGILLFGSQPFGLRADEQVGWMLHGGGQALYDEMYARFGLKPFLCGNSGPQWAGWFRNEINSSTTCAACASAPPASPPRCAKLGMAVAGDERARHVPGAAVRRAGRRRVHRPVVGLGARLPTRSPRTTTGNGVGEPSSAEECAVNLGPGTRCRTTSSRPSASPARASTTRSGPNTPPSTPWPCASWSPRPASWCEAGPTTSWSPWATHAGEVINELLADSDELVQLVRITESFLAYRNLMVEYMAHADNGQRNLARAGSTTPTAASCHASPSALSRGSRGGQRSACPGCSGQARA